MDPRARTMGKIPLITSLPPNLKRIDFADQDIGDEYARRCGWIAG